VDAMDLSDGSSEEKSTSSAVSLDLDTLLECPVCHAKQSLGHALDQANTSKVLTAPGARSRSMSLGELGLTD